uniref:DUF6824 domain-containing protein n=1 Tax=Grammatophora oceanica TaxID=210454 RepID=A0A7S1VR48_9STRA|mmetsp:Transcript_53796/g.80273  ORF Transcript_53796/g.80273 Transcript_53796/m.80273 type:complete len:332 (+) Transcript_53796:191-1186(+)
MTKATVSAKVEQSDDQVATEGAKEPSKIASADIKPYPSQREGSKLPAGANPATKLEASETQGQKEKPDNNITCVDKPYPTQREALHEYAPKATKPPLKATYAHDNGKLSAVSQITEVEPMNIDDFYQTKLRLAGLPDPPAPPAPEMPLLVMETDVIFGRGGISNHHRGNIRYRMLVKTYQRVYLQAKRHDKPKIAMLIVETIRREKGRFLKKDDKTQQWHDVGNPKAREKTSQALREKAPEIRAEQGLSKYPTKKDKAKSPFMGLDVVSKGMNFGDAETAMLIATRQALASSNKKSKTEHRTYTGNAASVETTRDNGVPGKPNPSKPPREI